jgi:glucose-1-phosphatase
MMGKGKSKIQAVLFDLGGVILRTDDPQPRKELAQSFGLSYADLDTVVFSNPVSQLAECGQATPEQVWAEIGRRLNLDGQQISIFRRKFFGGDQVDQELIEIISRIRGPYRTGLLSNTWMKDLARFIGEDLNIPDIFDVILSSAALGRAKPDKEIFITALEVLGTRAEETIFVDDNLENILAASRLGLHTVHFLNSIQARNDLLALIQISGMETKTEPSASS